MNLNTVELPCDIGDKVFIIDVDWSPCNICPHGKEMKNSPMVCVDSGNGYECPPQRYTIEEKICEAFLIDENGVSLPGAVDSYEGFYTHTGCDNQVYFSKTKARLIAKRYQNEQNHFNEKTDI
jgi:hypothetical protein